MRTIICDSVKETCISLTEQLIEIVDSISERDIFLAVSGGKTPAELFDLWAYQYEHRIPWERIQLFWVDERCVPPADSESNYRMTVRHLISKLPFLEKHIHRIHGEAQPELEAIRYGDLIRKLLPWENQFPVFDMILLGLGTDGHTASLFPGNEFPDPLMEELYVPDLEIPLNVAAYGADRPVCKVTQKPGSPQLRITLTLPVINNAKAIFFLITGTDKQMVFCNLRHHTAVSEEYPARYVKPFHGKLFYFVDEAAVTDACISHK